MITWLKPYFVIEVEGYEGRDGEIVVVNECARDDPSCGRPHLLYCVGEQGDDGVIRFFDWGYRTIEEALESWPDPVRSVGARADLNTVKPGA